MKLIHQSPLDRTYYSPNDTLLFSGTHEVDIFSDVFGRKRSSSEVLDIGLQLPVNPYPLRFEKWYGLGNYHITTKEPVFTEWVVYRDKEGYVPIYVTYIDQQGDRHKYIINRAIGFFADVYGDIIVETSMEHLLLHAGFRSITKDAFEADLMKYLEHMAVNMGLFSSTYVSDIKGDVLTPCHHDPYVFTNNRYKPLLTGLQQLIMSEAVKDEDSYEVDQALYDICRKHMLTPYTYMDPFLIKTLSDHHLTNIDVYRLQSPSPIDVKTFPLRTLYPTIHVPNDKCAHTPNKLCDLLATHLHVTDIDVIYTLDRDHIEPLTPNVYYTWFDRYVDGYGGEISLSQAEHDKTLLYRALNAVVDEVHVNLGLTLDTITYVQFRKTSNEEALLEFHPWDQNPEHGFCVVFDLVYATLTCASLTIDYSA